MDLDKKNSVAKVLFSIGIIEIIVCFIIGIMAGSSSYDEFDLMAAVVWWIGGFISGMLIIGFSEVIFLLEKIFQRLKGEENKVSVVYSDYQQDKDIDKNQTFKIKGIIRGEHDKLKVDSHTTATLFVEFKKITVAFVNGKYFEILMTNISDCEIEDDTEHRRAQVKITYKNESGVENDLMFQPDMTKYNFDISKKIVTIIKEFREGNESK